MLDSHFKKEEFKNSVKENVKMLYRKTIDEATQEQVFQAVSLAVKDVVIDNWLLTQKLKMRSKRKRQSSYIISPWNF